MRLQLGGDSNGKFLGPGDVLCLHMDGSFMEASILIWEKNHGTEHRVFVLFCLFYTGVKKLILKRLF